MFKKKIQCTFLSTHSLIQQVGMNINFMPSIVVGTGDAAVNKRQKILPSWSLYSSIMRKTNKYMSGYAKCYGEKRQGKGAISCSGGGGCCSLYRATRDLSEKGLCGLRHKVKDQKS